jgi:hypothetical protein
MDNRGYAIRFMKALTISIIAALCTGIAVPASAMPNMPHLLPSTRSLPAAAMVLMSATRTEIALAATPAMPRPVTATSVNDSPHNSTHGGSAAKPILRLGNCDPQITVSKAAQIAATRAKSGSIQFEFLPQWRGSILRSRLMTPSWLRWCSRRWRSLPRPTPRVRRNAALAEMKQVEAEIDAG